MNITKEKTLEWQETVKNSKDEAIALSTIFCFGCAAEVGICFVRKLKLT